MQRPKRQLVEGVWVGEWTHLYHALPRLADHTLLSNLLRRAKERWDVAHQRVRGLRRARRALRQWR